MRTPSGSKKRPYAGSSLTPQRPVRRRLFQMPQTRRPTYVPLYKSVRPIRGRSGRRRYESGNYLSRVVKCDVGPCGVVTHLNVYNRGDSLKTRQKDVTLTTSLVINGRVVLNDAAKNKNHYQYMFMWIVIDKCPGSQVRGMAEIFDITTTIDDSADPEMWVKNPDHASRFVILTPRKRWTLIGGPEDGGHAVKYVDMVDTCYFPKILSYFRDSSAGDLESIDTGALYLVLGTYYKEPWSVSLHCKLKFRCI